MIKCIGSLRLLKQFLFILLISCFTLSVGSFVSALNYEYGTGLVGDITQNNINNNIDVGVLNYYDFYSSFLGNNKRIFAFNDVYLFWWNLNNRLSFGYYDWNFNGDVEYFYVCDSVGSSFYGVFSNCNSYKYSTYISTINNFLLSVSVGDMYFYGDVCGSTSCVLYQGVDISNSNQSIVFPVYVSWGGQLNQNFDYGGLKIPSDFTNIVVYDNSQHEQNIALLENVDHLGYNFGTLPNSIIGISPAYPLEPDNPPEHGTSTDIIDVISGSYVYTNCTYQSLIDYMESAGASKYLCYGGLDNFDLYNPNTTYNPIPGTGKTLAQILAYSNSWDTPLEWYNFRNGLRGGYSDMWSSYPAVYKTWFDIYYQYGGNTLEFDSVREYCSMLSMDIDFQNTVYRGQYFKQMCNYIQDHNFGIYDGSGNVVVGVNWDGIGNLSGNSVKTPVLYLQDFFDKLKVNIPTRYDLGLGALPVYIISFLCAIILFRFLSH